MPRVRQPVLAGAAIVFVAATLSARSVAPAGSQEMLSRLQRWLEAVNVHQPGKRDAAAERIGAWKNAELEAVTPYIETLVLLLPSPGDTSVEPRPRSIGRADIERIRQLARLEAAHGDVNRIMKAGAMLHADIMMSGAGRPERMGLREAARMTSKGGTVTVLGVDGQHESFAVIPPHWPLARLLLHAVHPDPASDDFVRLWYRATTAYMLQRSQWGSVDQQLRHARERLTPGADFHMDYGTLYEAYASVLTQSIMTSAKGRGARFDVQAPEANLRLAEMHYSQALVLDPGLLEARVRLARVRIALGRPAEAVAELEAASTASSDPVVRYYAVLFLGQAQEALERYDAARAAYQRAAMLYPMSQSPHLALSLLAREAGDRAAAQVALGNFLRTPTSNRIRYDPWWVYFMGNGRNMRELVFQLWASAPREATS